jgi:hypothetical protein
MAGELSLDDCQIADVGEHHEINIFRVLLKPHWEIPPGPGQSPAAHLGVKRDLISERHGWPVESDGSAGRSGAVPGTPA